jgi:hypothetical protein
MRDCQPTPRGDGHRPWKLRLERLGTGKQSTRLDTSEQQRDVLNHLGVAKVSGGALVAFSEWECSPDFLQNATQARNGLPARGPAKSPGVKASSVMSAAGVSLG